MNAKASTLHPMYNSLFVGPSNAQIERSKRNEQAQGEFMATLRAYEKENGSSMGEEQATKLYKAILSKWNL